MIMSNSTYNQLTANLELLKLTQMKLHLDEIRDFVTTNGLSFTEGLLKLSNYEVEFITIHQLSSKKLNYISEHYAAIARKSHIFRDEHIMDRAKENLEIIGKVYDYE